MGGQSRRHLQQVVEEVTRQLSRAWPHPPSEGRDQAIRTYGSLSFTGDSGNPRTTFSYKSGGRFQRSRRRICTSVSGDSRACVCPLISTTLTLIVFIALSSNSALGRAVLRPG